ncbi:MAG: efflux RND transporter periplasmic adaptor subunit [Puniceicoccales bacterium]|jgi:membrane fusion protein (multidrug efflux system)|nr:efflux RND transporter periplasmic adaptor subunit [Puniceicoccales bacterium]
MNAKHLAAVLLTAALSVPTGSQIAAAAGETPAKPASPAAGETSAKQPVAAPQQVGVIALKATRIPVVKKLPGRVAALRSAEVRARVPGILLKQKFREGTDVKEGDALFQIEPAPFEARVAAAKANVLTAKADIALAEANLKQTTTLWRRYKELVGTKAISVQDYDNAEASKIAAEARLDAAKSQLSAAEAALKTAEIDLGYTNVTAPISGRIGRPFVTEGALVGQASVTPLAEINQLDPVYVDFSQGANDLSSFKQKVGSEAKWKTNLSVSLVLDNDAPYPHAGELLVSEITVDPNTGSVKLRAKFPNTDWLLWPGMYVWGEFKFNDDVPVFLVPQQSVARDESGASIFVVDEQNTVAKVPVVTDETSGTNWVIRNNKALREGLSVIVDGGMQAAAPLKPGQTVTPVPWKPLATK